MKKTIKQACKLSILLLTILAGNCFCTEQIFKNVKEKFQNTEKSAEEKERERLIELGKKVISREEEGLNSFARSFVTLLTGSFGDTMYNISKEERYIKVAKIYEARQKAGWFETFWKGALCTIPSVVNIVVNFPSNFATMWSKDLAGKLTVNFPQNICEGVWLGKNLEKEAKKATKWVNLGGAAYFLGKTLMDAIGGGLSAGSVFWATMLMALGAIAGCGGAWGAWQIMTYFGWNSMVKCIVSCIVGISIMWWWKNSFVKRYVDRKKRELNKKEIANFEKKHEEKEKKKTIKQVLFEEEKMKPVKPKSKKWFWAKVVGGCTIGLVFVIGFGIQLYNSFRSKNLTNEDMGGTTTGNENENDNHTANNQSRQSNSNNNRNSLLNDNNDNSDDENELSDNDENTHHININTHD